jgi:outer membrane protein OmpA-like peptidoglycan-associated protein
MSPGRRDVQRTSSGGHRRIVWSGALAILSSFALLVVPVAQNVTGALTVSTRSGLALGSLPRAATTGVTVPDGTPNSSEPSGEAPPSSTAMAGYQQTYVNDFTGSSIPSGWDVYAGKPGGDPGGQWADSHVQVGDGILQLSTWQDSAYGGEWVAGGLCQCGVQRTYGAYFVRSRVTGAGPTQVELLWPTQGWPPEIDFDETNGGTDYSMATLHFTTANSQIHDTIDVDMTQWHTWGVIWTPTSVSYTMDGSIWAQVNIPADVPHQPMTLDIQQQTWCGVAGTVACPTTPEDTQVDWVAEYKSDSPNPTTTTTIPISSSAKAYNLRPFAANSASLSPLLKSQVMNLANQISADNDSSVALTGYSDSAPTQTQALAISWARALTVDRYLRQLLVGRGVTGVTISISGAGSAKPVASNATPSGRAKNRRVLAKVS